MRETCLMILPRRYEGFHSHVRTYPSAHLLSPNNSKPAHREGQALVHGGEVGGLDGPDEAAAALLLHRRVLDALVGDGLAGVLLEAGGQDQRQLRD